MEPRHSANYFNCAVYLLAYFYWWSCVSGDNDADDGDAVRARELARQKREMCQRFMKEEQARRLEESRRAHERQMAEDKRIAEIAREKALKDELFKAKKASDDDTRQLIRQRVSCTSTTVTL